MLVDRELAKARILRLILLQAVGWSARAPFKILAFGKYTYWQSKVFESKADGSHNQFIFFPKKAPKYLIRYYPSLLEIKTTCCIVYVHEIMLDFRQ